MKQARAACGGGGGGVWADVRTSALFTCLPRVAVKKKTGEENNEAHVAT
jgi:hypothetical protein